MKVVVIGNGYIGSAFVEELSRRRIETYVYNRTHTSSSKTLRGMLEQHSPSFVINAAGYVGQPNVDECENNKAQCLTDNVILPSVISQVCSKLEIPWGHVSSGCIYSGNNLSEEDKPNFTFADDRHSFYSGTKAMAEQVIDAQYIWRLRMPYDNINSPRNYISKILKYTRTHMASNSITHRGEFVKACLQLWTQGNQGTFNITNGAVHTSVVVWLIKKYLKPNRTFDQITDPDDFITPRSDCTLSMDRIKYAGIEMTPVLDSLEDCLINWK